MRTGLDWCRSVFAALVAYLVLISVLDEVTYDSAIRLAPAAALAPVVACALLSLRRTAVICALYVVSTALLYGPWGLDLSVANRVTVLGSALALSVVTLFVCRVRVQREERFNRLRLTAGAAQRLLLRSLPLPAGEVMTDGFYLAAEKEALVGGDIYEVLSTPYGVRVVIGDVRGRGLAAIGASAAVLTAFREAAYRDPVLQTVVDRMEEALVRYEPGVRCEPEEEFVTALVAEMMGPEALRVIDCGHVPPFVISGDEVVEVQIKEPGLPLGLQELAGEPRCRQDIKIPRGGRMVLCTDGVIEARDPDGEFYPLAERLRQWLHLPTAELLERLREDLPRHAGGHLGDDAALLVIQR
ncbi:PP2C family protein-serine/threonine phosphatase [Streptomyces sp. NPDC093598]|uniref:PP2C family protein-serine/threonine phosphatase n=1 Tax=Streptomyces sp. NPDC093598 TaxID=3366046 RepID=UPI0037F61516